MRGALVILLVAGAAHADTAPHKEGQYGGVTPGESQPRDAAAKPAKPKRPPAKGTLTWIGFEAKDGGAQVFFQSVGPFELSQRVEGASLVVHLRLSRLGHNTWRQVDTRFFDNPLAGVVARTVRATRTTRARPGHAAGIEARIAFKNAKDVKEASVRTATEADGMYYAYLSFPEGTDGNPALPSAPSMADPEPEVEAAPEVDSRPRPQQTDDEAPPRRNGN
ncbi:MAG: hypothetical protein H7138_14565 [Myxococcales bacterium]|nr:hypothetical protein [Myxococcales bacterium]